MIFHPIDADGFDILRGWFSDPELRRRIDYPSQDWYRWVTEVPGNHAWLIYEEALAIGHVQLDTQPDSSGSVGIIVRPDLRGRGVGKRILQGLQKRSEVNALERVEAWIEEDNTASLRCFLSAGFRLIRDDPDENGLLVLVWEPPGDAHGMEQNP